MSLLRLLTAGKSLVGLKKFDGRYHLPGEKSLPRFGSKKNPFRATVFPEKAEPGATEATPAGQASPESSCPAEESGKAAPEIAAPAEAREADGGRKEAAGSAPGRIDRGPREQVSAAEARAPRRKGIKAFLLWHRAKKTLSPGRFNKRPLVQGELSLDTVRVMRNDLSESDLEVVQARPAPTSKKPKDSGDAVAKRSALAGDYEAAVGHLLGVGKM